MNTDFLTFCRDNGIVIDYLPPLGRIRPYPTEDKPKSTNGRVMYDGDFGWCQNWRYQEKPVFWFRGKDAKTLTEAEKQQLKQRQMAESRKVAREQAKAISDMQSYFRTLKPLHGNHPYLENKGLDIRGCAGLRVDGESLVIPMVRNGDLISLQTIAPDGTKKFRYGCPTKGASFQIGSSKAPIAIFCEGFATGLTIYQAMPSSRVIVCFNANGLRDVAVRTAKAFRGMACICADNDHKTEKKPPFINPGLDKGKEAARAIGCGIAYPKGIEGSDWDDARQEWEEGISDPERARRTALARVKTEIMRHVRAVKPVR